MSDDARNTYGVAGIEGPNTLGNDWSGALTGVVRVANAADAVKAGTASHRGMAIRLKPHSGGGCSQSLRGTNRSNLLDGSMSDCDELVFGYGGDDILIGGAGTNKLNGGKGADVIAGGGGADTFVYERAADSPVDAPDSITDFNSRDTIDLGRLARTQGIKLSYIGWNEFTGVAGQVNYSIMEYWECDPNWNCFDRYVTTVGVDLTGNGTADFCIDLMGRHHPKAANFVLKDE